MIVLWIIGFILIFCFGGVLLFGAPYLPTLSAQIEAAFSLANVQPGQRLVELGCGDGKVLVAAARAGMQVTGYELNPILAAISWLRTRRYRKQVTVICANFWISNWPPSEVIFCFLLQKYMKKLDTKIVHTIETHKMPIALVSFAFEIPDKTADGFLDGVHLYRYPKIEA